jgi:gliding motility-associated-like protein
MKSLLIIPFTVFSCWLFAQAPVNDDCAGIINLGIAPYCSNAAQFTNLNATTSNIDPLFNIPDCFNNNADRDVWFQFTLPADGSLLDITVSVFGDINNNGTLRMPQIAMYRGDCVFGGLSELSCIAAPLNVNQIALDFLGLNAGETYFLRINDYSATGTPNAGTFKLCIEPYVADFNMGEVPGSQSCTGTLWDSGGPSGDYEDGEDLTFVICPQDFHQCIQINLLEYSTEAGSDEIRIYEGNGVSGTLFATFDGAGVNDVVNVSTTGCATVAFESDFSVVDEGFQLTWQCYADLCPANPPIPPAASTCSTALKINGCSTTVPNNIGLMPGMGDPEFLNPLNGGCILNPSQDLNFSFFYFEALADGEFSFLVKNADANNPSDIDFSVWGPIDSVQAICNFVNNNQPVRSSWTAAPTTNNTEGYTGLTNVNPYNGSAITDEYDCGSPATPGTTGTPPDDSFVKNLEVQQGKIYVVLLDDYDGAVESEDGISIDFSGTSPGVLDPLPGTAINIPDDVISCPGQPVQLIASGGLDYAWTPGNTLSCNECPAPFATPFESTTYTVQVATVCGVLTDSVRVTILDLNLGPDATVCLGASFQLNENAFSGDYVWFGATGLSCSDCPSPTFSATNTGIFIFNGVITTPFCSDTDQVRITVLPGFQPETSVASDTAICVGDIVSLGGPPMNAFTYSWTSNPPGFTSSVANPPVVSPNTTTTYYLQTTSPACAVTRTDSVVVTVYDRPVLDVIDGASFCLGGSAQLANTVFQPFVTYAWTPDNGTLDDPQAANPTATPVTPGANVYTVTASNPGCSVSRSVPLQVIDLQLNLSVPDTILLCQGDEREILVNVSPAGSQPLWSPLQQIDLSPDGLVATVYPLENITYTVSASLPGCTRTKQVFVQVDSLPQFLNISPEDTSVCIGSIVLLKNPDNEPLFEPSAFPDMTFFWAPSDGLITPDTLPFVYTQPSDTIVYYRITVNGGCRDTVFATVNVIEPPEMSISPEVSIICPDSFVVLTALAPGVDSLIWSPATTLSCEDCLMPIATPLTTTTYTLSGEYKSCPLAVSAIVNVTPKPLYQFPANGLLCAGETLLLNEIADPSVVSYNWSSNPPSVIDQIAQPSVLLDGGGVQSITYYLEANNGCAAVDSFTVLVTDAGLTVSAPDTICPEATKLITASVAIGGGQFLWKPGGTTDQAIVVAPTATTTYVVSYLLNGCTFQDSVTITVQGETPDIEFPADAVLCPGDTVLLNTVATPGATYQWTSNVGGFTSQDAIPDPQTPATTTEYTVTATSQDGCSVTKSLTVTVFNATLAVSDDVTVCAGVPFTVFATGSATGTYLWEPIDSTSPSFTQTLDIAQNVTYTVLYTYGTPGNECFLEDMVEITVLPAFNIKIVADPDSVLVAGAPLMLDAVIQPSQNVNGFTFQWLENNTLEVGSTQQVTVTSMTTDTTVTYTVTAVSPNGCSQTESIQLRVLQPVVEIPNAFSPNGDGSNDVFRLAILEGLVTVERLEIYNRWGQKVYESTAADASWDGKSGGDDAASDVYVYKIRYRRSDGSLSLESGEVTLIR